MTTGQLIKKTHRRYKRYLPSESDARIVVAGILNIIQDGLANDGVVRLTHIGTLKVHSRIQPETLFGEPNPNAGKVVKQVTLRDSTGMKERLNG